MQARKTRVLGKIGVATVLLLAGCGQVNSPSPPMQSYEYTAAVPVSANDSQSSVSRLYAGSVLVWQPDAGFAVLGLHEPLPESQIRTLSLDSAPVTVELNRDAFGASGTSSAWSGKDGAMDAAGRAYIWSGGRAYIWSGGRAYIWSGGTGVVGGIPENNAAWNQIGLPAAWAAAPNLGEGVKVAVIDSGIDLKHEMFQGSLADPQDQWDFVDNDAVPQEEGTFSDEAFGHGTNVAGIVLQMAPHAKIMPLRVLAPDGSGDATTVAQAINFAVTHGAQVINLSLGSVEKTDVIQKMLQFATSKGVNVIASSGNTGDDHITYPARYAEDGGSTGQYSVSVGSVDWKDRKSDFSTYGDKLEIVAPGEKVWGPVPGNLFSYWSGTSMASPMVAGALALARGQTLIVKPTDLTKSLLATADNIDKLNHQYEHKIGARLNIGTFIQAVTRGTVASTPTK